MREADVALFPNRAEGVTNLVAMEAMACGVPTILSANTGHLDIVAEGACIPLRRQRPVVVDDRYLGTGGWGESDVEEMVEALRSEEHTSELQSLMRSSYPVFCLKKKKTRRRTPHTKE